MANEITSTLLGTNGGLVASVLSDTVLQLIYDATDLSGLGVFMPWSPMGSTTMDVTQDAVPGAFTAATSETDGSNITNSAYTTSEFSLTPSLYARRYELTDLLPVAGGPIQVDRVARKLVDGIALTNTDLICGLFTGLSGSVGTTTVDLDVDTIYAAQYALNNNLVPGPYACVLYPEQMNNFRESLRAEPGAVQFIAATAEMLVTKGPGFQGTWNGIEFYQSDSVPTANSGADSAGAMFGRGCFGWTAADPRVIAPHINSGDIVFANERVLLELVRDKTNFRSALVAQYYPSWVEVEDVRGVQIISDR